VRRGRLEAGEEGRDTDRRRAVRAWPGRLSGWKDLAMALTVLLCTDGSELAHHALAAGLAVVGKPDRVVVATVVEAVDPTLVVGTGFAGGVMGPEQALQMADIADTAAQQTLDSTVGSLRLEGAEKTVLVGHAGPVLCDYATTLPASVIIIGTRGRGGLKRAVLGSVSDHVVRHAPCPVLTVTSSGD